jgi:phosphate transport system substrate-binding protein
MRQITRGLAAGIVSIALVFVFGCEKQKNGTASSSGGGDKTIVVDGSDTMVNLSQAWAEAYTKIHPDVHIQVSGGGSGVGIASLIGGKLDMANASRKMTDKEIASFKQNNPGKEPKEHVMGIDALAIYANPKNPIETISVEELAEIYGDGGKIDKWSQLGINNTACPGDEITRVSRQNNSGTYAYFREHVLGKTRDYKNGSIDQSGSKDVVALVAKTPCAIGYSGMGYKTDEVKWLKVSKKKGETGIMPSIETAVSGTYPISRPLFIYTPGEATGAVKDFIDWCNGPAGQQIVKDVGFVPLPKEGKKVASR